MDQRPGEAVEREGTRLHECWLSYCGGFVAKRLNDDASHAPSSRPDALDGIVSHRDWTGGDRGKAPARDAGPEKLSPQSHLWWGGAPMDGDLFQPKPLLGSFLLAPYSPATQSPS